MKSPRSFRVWLVVGAHDDGTEFIHTMGRAYEGRSQIIIRTMNECEYMVGGRRTWRQFRREEKVRTTMGTITWPKP